MKFAVGLGGVVLILKRVFTGLNRFILYCYGVTVGRVSTVCIHLSLFSSLLFKYET